MFTNSNVIPFLYGLIGGGSGGGGGGGGGGSGIESVVFTSTDWENVTCNKTPAQVAALIEAGTPMYITFIGGNGGSIANGAEVIQMFLESAYKMGDVMYMKISVFTTSVGVLSKINVNNNTDATAWGLAFEDYVLTPST